MSDLQAVECAEQAERESAAAEQRSARVNWRDLRAVGEGRRGTFSEWLSANHVYDEAD